MADAMPVYIWTALPDGNIEFVNHVLDAFLGGEPGALLGERWINVTHPDDRPTILETWGRCLRTGERYNLTFRCRRAADGVYRWLDVSATPIRDESGAIVKWIGVSLDNHDLHETRDALARSEARYRLYAEATGDGMWYHEYTTGHIEWNDRMSELCGLSRETFELNMTNLKALYHPDDLARITAVSVAHIQRGEPYRFEVRMKHGSGEYRTYFVHGLAARDQSGAPLYITGGLRDITEERKTNLILRERLEIIERQAAEIRELSAPIIEVWDGVLTMPVLATIDGARAQRMMEVLLAEVTERQCRHAIIDLTGVRKVDVETAEHIARMLAAVRLLGAEGIIVGIQPEVARTIIGLSLELPRMTVLASLREALLYCMRRAGTEASLRGRR